MSESPAGHNTLAGIAGHILLATRKIIWAFAPEYPKTGDLARLANGWHVESVNSLAACAR